MFKLIDCGRVSRVTKGTYGMPFIEPGSAWPFNTRNGA